MPEVATRRRRWAIRLALLLLVLYGVRLAWQYRPLSAMEHRLLGIWLYRHSDPRMLRDEFQLFRNHRLLWRRGLVGPPPVTMQEGTGSWRVEAGHLVLEHDLPGVRQMAQNWRYAYAYIPGRGGQPRTRYETEFRSDDIIRLGPDTGVNERLYDRRPEPLYRPL